MFTLLITQLIGILTIKGLLKQCEAPEHGGDLETFDYKGKCYCKCKYIELRQKALAPLKLKHLRVLEQNAYRSRTRHSGFIHAEIEAIRAAIMQKAT